MVTPLTSNENRQGADYYAAGNKEVSTETALTLNRLEPVSSHCACRMFLIVHETICTDESFVFLTTLHIVLLNTSTLTRSDGSLPPTRPGW